MLKALFFHLMNLALAAIATAQNLVPNPSFEDTTYCVGWPPPKVEALHWYTANTATPDIWDCDTIDPCGYHVMNPNDEDIQYIGYKPAFDGSRFAGGYHWYGAGGSNNRDYLTARLTQGLQSEHDYRVSLWCTRPAGFNGAIDHIGVYFGPDSIHESYPTTLPYTPQVELRDPGNAYLEDTAWVQLVDTFTAVGGEEWITFGTFSDADEVDGIWLGWGSFPPHAYYYIDLISVEPLSPASVTTIATDFSFLSANSREIFWNGPGGLECVYVFDGAGRMVWHPVVIGAAGEAIVVPETLSEGAYLVQAIVGSRRYFARFIK